MSIFIKPGFWDERTIAPKYWFNLEQYIKSFIPPVVSTTTTTTTAPPYKVYTALITQSGTNPPTSIVLENTIGTITFTYTATGFYSAVSTGLFTLNKTACFINESNGNTTLIAKANNVNSVTILSQSPTGNFQNDSIDKATLEIRVYS
jgi:hypothetical protein